MYFLLFAALLSPSPYLFSAYYYAFKVRSILYKSIDGVCGEIILISSIFFCEVGYSNERTPTASLWPLLKNLMLQIVTSSWRTYPRPCFTATPLYFIAEGGLCLKFNQTAIEIPLDRVAIISIASQLGNVLSKSLRLQIVTLEV